MNYYNDFNQHKKSDTVKWVVAFVLIAVLLFGVAASLLISLRPTENTTVPETENEEVIVEEGTVTDDNGNELESGTIYAMSSRMLFSSPTALTSNATDGVTIEATVSPISATDKTVDWSIAWVNPESDWATDKVVTDYVTVTPESDGSTIATVVCLQGFSEQVQITVTSRNNTNASATCIVDYRAKLSMVRADIDDNIVNGALNFYDTRYNTDIDSETPTGFVIINPLSATEFNPEFTAVPTVGTVGGLDIINLKTNAFFDMRMIMTPELIAAIEDAGFTVTNEYGYMWIDGGTKLTVDTGTSGIGGWITRIMGLIQNCTNYDSLTEAEQQELFNLVVTYNADAAFRLYLAYTEVDGSEANIYLSTYCEVILNPAVTSVSLDSTTLEF